MAEAEVRTEIQCRCAEQCGNSFKVSGETLKRIEAFEDLAISLVCPNMDLNNEFIIEKLDDFAIVATLEKSD
jgi:hypothetical protein